MFLSKSLHQLSRLQERYAAGCILNMASSASKPSSNLHNQRWNVHLHCNPLCSTCIMLPYFYSARSYSKVEQSTLPSHEGTQDRPTNHTNHTNNENPLEEEALKFFKRMGVTPKDSKEERQLKTMYSQFQELHQKNENKSEAWQQFQNYIEEDKSFQEALRISNSGLVLNGIEVPPEICCPLSNSIFVDPVQLPNGNVYSRGTLKLHFESIGKQVDPFSGEELAIDIDSLPVFDEVQSKIKVFMKEHGSILQEAIEKEYHDLLRKYETMSEKDPNILHQLGKCYFNGNGVKKDIDKGIILIQKAADNGSIAACVDMGEYLTKLRNFEEAYEYFLKAANDDNGYAAYRVGVALLSGLGVEKNVEEALDYFTQAADLGEAGGFWGLGACLLRGIGTDKDIYQGYKCLVKAAEMGMPSAQHLVGILLKDGKFIGRNTEEAVKWLQMASNSGHTQSMVTLGTMIINRKINQPPYEAVKLFKKAAQAGDATGFYNLSKCFEFGYGVKKDIEIARHCMKRAKDLGFKSEKSDEEGLL